ncbi:hypothetical protein, partial [Bacillus altitudinis]|uniref:hypothetical protein n=1 Tax=Bacillus altitudinis TaxID=293387 RepID=UPI00119FFEDB
MVGVDGEGDGGVEWVVVGVEGLVVFDMVVDLKEVVFEGGFGEEGLLIDVQLVHESRDWLLKLL